MTEEPAEYPEFAAHFDEITLVHEGAARLNDTTLASICDRALILGPNAATTSHTNPHRAAAKHGPPLPPLHRWRACRS